MTAYAPYPGLGSQEALRIILEGLDAYKGWSKAGAIDQIKQDLKRASAQAAPTEVRSNKHLLGPG